MKIERLLFGMQTADGKILAKYTSGVLSMLQPKSRQSIQALTAKDNGKKQIFPTEQVIAVSIIRNVAVKDPKQGGKTFHQNQTFLTTKADFINHYLTTGTKPFMAIVEENLLSELEKFPESFEPINV